MPSALKTARLLGLGKDDAIVTVATDGANLYRSEYDKIVEQRFGGSWTRDDAARVADRHLGVDTDHILELDERARDRIFNLGYYTWVEQQGKERLAQVVSGVASYVRSVDPEQVRQLYQALREAMDHDTKDEVRRIKGERGIPAQ